MPEKDKRLADNLELLLLSMQMNTSAWTPESAAAAAATLSPPAPLTCSPPSSSAPFTLPSLPSPLLAAPTALHPHLLPESLAGLLPAGFLPATTTIESQLARIGISAGIYQQTATLAASALPSPPLLQSAVPFTGLLSPPLSLATFPSSSLSTLSSSVSSALLPGGETTSASSPSSAFSFLQPPLDDVNSPISFRRRSAPEGAVAPTSSTCPAPTDRRRFSDFSIERILGVEHAQHAHLPTIHQQPPPPRRHSTASVMSSSHHERKSSSCRKQRTIYGNGQTKALEAAFNSHKYMVGTEREELATRLGLSETQVRVWFQNRRSKQRKLCKATSASSTGSSSATSAGGHETTEDCMRD